MLSVQHVSAGGSTKKSKFTLPDWYSDRVNEGAMYHAVRAFLANRRQGTHSTKTRAEVSGGRSKPWKQKGTGRARAGTTRASQWRGGGVVFGPRPRHYHVKLPRKVKRLARQSALNVRAVNDGMIVIEPLGFDQPKTRRLLEILAKTGIGDRRVLILTAGHEPSLYLSGRNLSRVHVMRYDEVTAFEVLWSEIVLVEEGALGTPAEGVGTDA